MVVAAGQTVDVPAGGCTTVASVVTYGGDHVTL